jgi:hypothetical protein
MIRPCAAATDGRAATAHRTIGNVRMSEDRRARLVVMWNDRFKLDRGLFVDSIDVA